MEYYSTLFEAPSFSATLNEKNSALQIYFALAGFVILTSLKKSQILPNRSIEWSKVARIDPISALSAYHHFESETVAISLQLCANLEPFLDKMLEKI